MKTTASRLTSRLCAVAALFLFSVAARGQAFIWSRTFSGGSPAKGQPRTVIRMSDGNYMAAASIGPIVKTHEQMLLLLNCNTGGQTSLHTAASATDRLANGLGESHRRGNIF